MSPTKKIEGEKSWLGGRLTLKEMGQRYGGSAEAVGYHGNGRLRFSYPMQDGKFHGTCRCWSENEQLIVEEFYECGKLHGMSREWFESGALKKQSVHLKGVLCSERSWHMNGQLKSAYEYRGGYPVSGKQWFSNGQLECEELYGNKGVSHGPQRGWYENGVLNHELYYVNGVPHGPQRTWFSNGRIHSDFYYREGRRHGLCQTWDKKGESCSRKYYLRDVWIPKKLEQLILAGKLDAQAILKIRNAAIRRICLEEFGFARFLSQVEHAIVDRDGEQKLVKIRWHPREETLCLVKVQCPSTGAFYTLRVPPQMKTVKEAVAWTFDVNADEYKPLKET